MRTLVLFLGVLFATVSIAQDWKTPQKWISKENALKAQKILKEKKSATLNPNCASSWSAVVSHTIKKVVVKESTTGEGNYDIFITYLVASGAKYVKQTDTFFLDQIKVENDKGELVYLAELLGITKGLCRADD